MKSPYEILNIHKNSTEEEVKKAYHDLARKYHPDKNSDPDAEERFKEIKYAYETIQNKNSYHNYNYNQNQNGFGNFPGASYFNGEDFRNMFKIFKKDKWGGVMNDIQLFRDYYNKRKNTFGKEAIKSESLHIHVCCNLEDIYSGKAKDLLIPIILPCKECLGLGRKTMENQFKICDGCKGQGILEKNESITLFLDRKTQEFFNKGNETIGERRGNINVSIFVKEHTEYKIINNYDLLYEKEVTLDSKTILLSLLDDTEREIDISSLTNKIGNKKICIKNHGLLYPIGFSKNRGSLIISLFIVPLLEDEEQETYSLILE